MKTINSVLMIFSLLFGQNALARGERERAEFAFVRGMEAVKILYSAYNNPELRDEEMREIILRLKKKFGYSMAKFDTSDNPRGCRPDAVAFVGSDRPNTVVFCPAAYQYDNPKFLIHELYHVLLRSSKGGLAEECMADLVAAVAIEAANQPTDLPIKARSGGPTPYRQKCIDKYGVGYLLRSGWYNLTLEEQAVEMKRLQN